MTKIYPWKWKLNKSFPFSWIFHNLSVWLCLLYKLSFRTWSGSSFQCQWQVQNLKECFQPLEMWWLPRERLSIQRRWKTWSLSNAICRCSKAWAWESDHIIDLVTFWNITTIDHKKSFLFDSLSRRIGCWWVICSHILHFCWLILCICANLSLVYFWIRSGGIW